MNFQVLEIVAACHLGFQAMRAKLAWRVNDSYLHRLFEVQDIIPAQTMMSRIDVVDEAIIDADPASVFKALIDEVNGRTHWWMPHLEFRLRGETPIEREGAIFDVTIHSRGTPRWTAKITKIVEGKLIELEEEGDFGNWNMDI